jgi:hypothetical protein
MSPDQLVTARRALGDMRTITAAVPRLVSNIVMMGQV